MLGEQVLIIFLCIERVRLNWNFIVYDVQNTTYSLHGAPCPARDLFPWINIIEWKYICMYGQYPEYPKRHSSYLSDSGIPSYYFLYFCHLSKKNAAQFDFQLDSKATWSELAIYYLNDNSYLMNMYISNTSFNNKVLTCISKGHNNGRDIIKSVIHILTFVSENQRWGAKLARLSYKY